MKEVPRKSVSGGRSFTERNVIKADGLRTPSARPRTLGQGAAAGGRRSMLAGQAFRISSQSPLRETRRSTSVSILGIELGRKVIAGFGRDERRGEGQTALCVERENHAWDNPTRLIFIKRGCQTRAQRTNFSFGNCLRGHASDERETSDSGSMRNVRWSQGPHWRALPCIVDFSFKKEPRTNTQRPNPRASDFRSCPRFRFLSPFRVKL